MRPAAIMLGLSWLGAAGPAIAQSADYPSRPVRLLVGFTPGSTTDTIGRLIALRMAESLGRQVLVDNRPGAGGNIAAELCAKAAPDGYTLLIANTGIAIAASAYRKLGYHVLRDLFAVGQVAASPHVLIVHPSLPVRTVSDLIAMAKARPGELNFSSTGAGNSDHFAAELFKFMTGVDMVHVAYKGGPQASGDVASGQIAAYFGGMAVAMPLHRAGRVRAIAVTTPERSPVAPSLPTMIESGLPGYAHVLWNVILAPAATPPAIITRLELALALALKSSELRERLMALGAAPYPRSAVDTQDYIRSETEKYAEVTKAINLRID